MAATLIAPGLGTLVLPFWPEGIDGTPSGQTWTERARPGRAPLLLPEGLTLEERRLDYIARTRDLAQPIEEHLDLLRAIRVTQTPVTLMLEQSGRGLWHMTELSIVEVLHNRAGQVTSAEVSVTLRQASDATVNVGPLPRVTHPMPEAKKKKNKRKK